MLFEQLVALTESTNGIMVLASIGYIPTVQAIAIGIVLFFRFFPRPA